MFMDWPFFDWPFSHNRYVPVTGRIERKTHACIISPFKSKQVSSLPTFPPDDTWPSHCAGTLCRKGQGMARKNMPHVWPRSNVLLLVAHSPYSCLCTCCKL